MIIQIYEIQSPQEAERCIALGVNRIGSVLLSRDAWRQPAVRDVIRLSGATGTTNSLIPLFQDRDTLYRTLDYYRPHYLHFCDSLTDPPGHAVVLDELIALQEDLKGKFPDVGLVRSIPVPANGVGKGFPVLQLARDLEPVSDLLLIDTWLGKEPVEGFVGITGKTCDWARAKELVLQANIPVILAGGLSPENAYEAVLAVLPAGVDSCTRTNATDPTGMPLRFKKDFHKVEGFVQEAKRAEATIRLRLQELSVKMESLQQELAEREAALPAHSVRPHQIMAIEDLEDEIAALERKRDSYLKTLGSGPGA